MSRLCTDPKNVGKVLVHRIFALCKNITGPPEYIIRGAANRLPAYPGVIKEAIVRTKPKSGHQNHRILSKTSLSIPKTKK
jgi:hypothetical protein